MYLRIDWGYLLLLMLEELLFFNVHQWDWNWDENEVKFTLCINNLHQCVFVFMITCWYPLPSLSGNKLIVWKEIGRDKKKNDFIHFRLHKITGECAFAFSFSSQNTRIKPMYIYEPPSARYRGLVEAPPCYNEVMWHTSMKSVARPGGPLAHDHYYLAESTRYQWLCAPPHGICTITYIHVLGTKV